MQKQQKKVILWEEFSYLEKLDGKILDLMSEFEEMDIQKEMREASKIRANIHLSMIRIDETLATTAAIPPTATKIVSETGESAKKVASVKLPKLVLQKFTWQRFWDVFE